VAAHGGGGWRFAQGLWGGGGRRGGGGGGGARAGVCGWGGGGGLGRSEGMQGGVWRAVGALRVRRLASGCGACLTVVLLLACLASLRMVCGGANSAVCWARATVCATQYYVGGVALSDLPAVLLLFE